MDPIIANYHINREIRYATKHFPYFFSYSSADKATVSSLINFIHVLSLHDYVCRVCVTGCLSRSPQKIKCSSICINSTLSMSTLRCPNTGEKENMLIMYQIIDFLQIFFFKRTNERKSI